MIEVAKIIYAYLKLASLKETVRRHRVKAILLKDTPEYRARWKVYRARSYAKNKTSLLEGQKAYRQRTREARRETDRRGAARNREKLRLRARIYRQNNKEKCAAAVEAWRLRNRRKHAGYVKKHQRKPHIQCHLRVMKALKAAFGRNRSFRKWESLLGYSKDELKRHLELLFTDGMTWETFCSGKIHIDHKVPKVRFKFDSVDHPEFKRCWALSNLQPLWAKDNLKKGSKLLPEFAHLAP